MRHVTFIAMLLSVLTIFAIKPSWLHMARTDGDIVRFKSVPLLSIDSLTFGRSNKDSLEYDILRIALRSGDSIKVEMIEDMEYTLGTNVPTIYIDTDSAVNDVTSKKDYLQGTFTMKSYGRYDDVDSIRINVRGRGNSSWREPKKPYRIKFEKKTSLCGLKKAKNYVLIANHIDNTLMKNAVAFEIARLFGLPYTNHSVPVNVMFNGKYKGAYMLSEKIGINAGSVDIDEASGIMWELDSYYDEDYKFKSSYFATPVMLKDPDPEDLDLPDNQTIDQWFKTWENDYNTMERHVYQGKYHEVIDEAHAVDYVLANLIAGNCELNWPKSVYMYKEAPDSLYHFGPVWDYDWAFNYIFPVDRPLLQPGSSELVGANLFYRMIRTERFQVLLRERWEYFKESLYPKLLDFIYDYSDMTRVSAYQNGELWSASGTPATPNSSETFDLNVNKLLEWIEGRIQAIDKHPNMLLY